MASALEPKREEPMVEPDCKKVNGETSNFSLISGKPTEMNFLLTFKVFKSLSNGNSVAEEAQFNNKWNLSAFSSSHCSAEPVAMKPSAPILMASSFLEVDLEIAITSAPKALAIMMAM
ncbi:hypothetical protein WICPIJ_003254 [Wickerhamomyces pijperi]|uniref:Uncharacterized protein n=1 Tax=Wickerhamomyces pijperi TaxID=599730 RepID=A0A9P8TPF2_WICPI|nr:hypothetical protein WICPIJ_003254 [Wickerhamomyces pijperi]